MKKRHATYRSHWPLVVLSTLPALFGILLPLVLVRVVPPDEVGTFKIFFLYLGMAPALSMTSGLRSSLAYWSGQTDQNVGAMKATSTILLAIAIAVTGAAFILQGQLSRAFHIGNLEAELFALSLLGAIAGSYFEEAVIATGRIWTGSLFYCGFEIARTVAIVTALFLSRTVVAVLIAHTAISVLKVFTGYLYGSLLGIVAFSFDREMLRAVWRCAMPVSIAYVFGLLIGSSDQLLLSIRISSSDFALYSIGCLSIAPLMIYEQSVTRVLVPQMAEAFARNAKGRATLLYQAAVDNLAFILVPAVVGLVVFATPIIELVFTERYSQASRYLQFFALSYLLLIIPHDALARSRGQSCWILGTFIIFALISLLLVISLIPLAGAFGALTAVLVAGAAMRIYALFYLRSQLAVTYAEFLPLGTVSRYTLISCSLGGIAFSLYPLYASNIAWLLQIGTLFSITYLILALPIKNRAERHRNRNKSVLILTQSLQIGGLEGMILHLSRQLKSHEGWRVHVLAYDHCDQKASFVRAFQEAEIPVETFQKPFGFSFRVVGRIIQRIYKNDIHIIHSHDLGTLMYAIFSSVLTFGKVGVVHTQHSLPQSEDTLRYRMYRRLFSLGIHKLSVVSPHIQDSYARFLFTSTRIHLIENGVEFLDRPVVDRCQKRTVRCSLFDGLSVDHRERLRRYTDDLWVIYQARFSPGKGQEHALALWKSMRTEDRQRCILCMVGPEAVAGAHQRVESSTQDCPDHDRIFIIPGSDTPLRWLSASDLFLSCSEYEGMPLAPLEAAGSGLPLLLSRIPGHAFLNEYSLQFSLDDIQQGANHMASLFSRILDGGTLYQGQLWQKGNSLRQTFSVSAMAHKYAQLYHTA